MRVDIWRVKCEIKSTGEIINISVIVPTGRIPTFKNIKDKSRVEDLKIMSMELTEEMVITEYLKEDENAYKAH